MKSDIKNRILEIIGSDQDIYNNATINHMFNAINYCTNESDAISILAEGFLSTTKANNLLFEQLTDCERGRITTLIREDS